MSEATLVARAALAQLVENEDLDEAAAIDLLHALTDPELAQPLIAAVLIALRMKGETAAEIRGFAKAMRDLSLDPKIPAGEPTVDCVGTGGDGSGSLNISTGAALLAAACGLRVVKHGNRAVSSKSGSADVLEALGMPLPLDRDAAVDCLEQTGFTFLFAPHYHPAMKTVAPVRAAMGVRSVFNLLGPLVNPARTPYALIGAFSPEAARLMADTLSGLDIERVFVVHGEPGWDEATPIGPFLLYDVRPGQVVEQHRDPAEYRMARCTVADLAGGDAAENAASLSTVFGGALGPHYDALALNAALLLEVAGAASGRRSSLAQVREAINVGRGVEILSKIRAMSLS